MILSDDECCRQATVKNPGVPVSTRMLSEVYVLANTPCLLLLQFESEVLSPPDDFSFSIFLEFVYAGAIIYVLL